MIIICPHCGKKAMGLRYGDRILLYLSNLKTVPEDGFDPHGALRTATAMISALGAPGPSIRSNLSALVREGLIARGGFRTHAENKRNPMTWYQLTDEGRKAAEDLKDGRQE